MTLATAGKPRRATDHCGSGSAWPPADVKRPVSVKAKHHLVVGNRHGWLDRLTVKKGKRTVFRFWQSGGGFDRNLTRRRNLWPVAEYIHANPVRRGLVEKPTDWAWSSAAYWEGSTDVPLEMDSMDL